MDGHYLKRMMEEIGRIAQCPICLEDAKAPIAQCVNGHISCGQCREGLRECSICRGPFIETINRVVEQLLNTLPKPCPYSDKGCNEWACLDTHVQFCQYRPISCKVGVDQSCNWFGIVKEWREHINSAHSGWSATYKFHSKITLSFLGFHGNWRSRGYYHQVNKEGFLFYAWKKGNEFCQTVRHVVCKEPQEEYFFKVAYCNNSGVALYQSLIKAEPLKEDESVEHHPVVFLLKDLKNLVREDKNLEILVEPLIIDFPNNI